MTNVTSRFYLSISDFYFDFEKFSPKIELKLCQTTILITKRRNLAFLKYFRSLPVFCVNQLLSIKTITKTRIRALKICKSEIEEFSEIREWQVFYDRKCFRISSKVWRVKCLPKISSSKELKILKSKKKMKFLKC